MKSKLLVIVAAIFAASCSSPKYTYKFDYHDYNSGRKEKQAMKEVAANPGPVEIQPAMLVAEAQIVVPQIQSEVEVAAPRTESGPLTLSRAERKEMVKDLRAMVKKTVKLNKADDRDHTTKAMDHDLKMSLIFLVVALAASLLYWVSPPLTGLIWLIAIIIAIVFFIKWLARQ